MERLNLYINKFLDYFPGFIFGISAIIVGLAGDFIAMALFPGYSILKNMVSTLGIGPGAIFFNLGIIFSGLIAIPFYIDLGRFVRNDENNYQTLRKTAITCAMISCVTMALVGIFPAIQNVSIIIILHYLTALTSWLTGMIYCTIFSFLMLKNPVFPKILAYIGFLPGGTILFLLILVVIPSATTLIPIVEWCMVFTIISYIAINSIYMIYKRT